MTKILKETKTGTAYGGLTVNKNGLLDAEGNNISHEMLSITKYNTTLPNPIENTLNLPLTKVKYNNLEFAYGREDLITLTDATDFRINYNGVYLINAGLYQGINAKGIRRAFLFKNGAKLVATDSVSNSDIIPACHSLLTINLCKAGDVITVLAGQNTGAALDLVVDPVSNFISFVKL